MRRRKKILIAVISICVLSVWIIFFIRMHIVVKEIAVGDLEIYDFKGFAESYGEPDEMYSDAEKDRYIVVNIHVKNISGQDIKIQNTISTWNMSIDNYTNGQSLDLMGFNHIPGRYRENQRFSYSDISFLLSGTSIYTVSLRG